MFYKGTSTTPLDRESVNVERVCGGVLGLKNDALHFWTFCRSLLVCIHDNTAVPTHLMQADQSTQQKQFHQVQQKEGKKNPLGL